jgi:hypothetical protein
MENLTLKEILKMEAFANGAVKKLTKINRKLSSTTTTASSTAVGSANATPNNNKKKDYRKPSDTVRLQLKDFVKSIITKSKLFLENDNEPYYLSAVKDMDADELLSKIIDAIYNKIFGTFSTKTFNITDVNESFAVPLDEKDIALWDERDTITIVPFDKRGLYYIQNFDTLRLYLTRSHFT